MCVRAYVYVCIYVCVHVCVYVCVCVYVYMCVPLSPWDVLHEITDERNAAGGILNSVFPTLSNTNNADAETCEVKTPPTLHDTRSWMYVQQSQSIL